MEKSGTLLLLQIDHLSGEEIGYLIETLYNRGARNVQVISTVTKKNRPGHLVLVDTGAVNEAVLAQVLARQFGVSGYHRLETVHCYQHVVCQTRPLVVRCGSQLLTVDLLVKVIGDLTAPVFVRAEYDGLVDLCRRIHQTFGVEPSLPELRLCIEARLAAGEPLELDLG